MATADAYSAEAPAQIAELSADERGTVCRNPRDVIVARHNRPRGEEGGRQKTPALWIERVAAYFVRVRDASEKLHGNSRTDDVDPAASMTCWRKRLEIDGRRRSRIVV
jgi:hypothetical protein